MDDDFEDIIKTGASLAPCTLRCGMVGRAGRQAKRVSVTFRTGKLDPDVVRILAEPALSAAYSPAQRVVRVRADPNGQYRLTLAPRADDVYLLRFPYPEKMPWIDKRVPVGLDVNAEQKAIFIEIPGVTPERQAALPAPGVSPARLTSPSTVAVTYDHNDALPLRLGNGLEAVTLAEHEAAALQILANGVKRNKTVLAQVLNERGYGDVKINALLGRLRQRLEPHHIELTESTDKMQVWLSPMALAALERALRGGV